MRRTIALLAGLIVCSAAFTQKPLEVKLSTPAHHAVVTHKQAVSGTLSDPNARVWLVIHPMETGEYWVQPPISVRKNGEWNVLANFGESEKTDSKKLFEVRAFTGVTSPIKEGKQDDWPSAGARSDLIEVVRQ